MMKQKMNRYYIPRPYIAGLHLFGVGVFLIFLIFTFLPNYVALDNSQKILLYVCCFALNAISVGYSIIFGWNSLIRFDEEGIKQKKYGKKLVWKWSQIDRMSFFSKGNALYMRKKVVIESKEIDKELIFETNPSIDSAFLENCPDEKMKAKYLHRIDLAAENVAYCLPHPKFLVLLMLSFESLTIISFAILMWKTNIYLASLVAMVEFFLIFLLHNHITTRGKNSFVRFDSSGISQKQNGKWNVYSWSEIQEIKFEHFFAIKKIKCLTTNNRAIIFEYNLKIESALKLVCKNEKFLEKYFEAKNKK